MLEKSVTKLQPTNIIKLTIQDEGDSKMSEKGFLARLSEKFNNKKTATLGVALAGAMTAGESLAEDSHKKALPSSGTTFVEYVEKEGFNQDEIQNMLEAAQSGQASEREIAVAHLYNEIKDNHSKNVINMVLTRFDENMSASEKLNVITQYSETLGNLYNKDLDTSNYFVRNSPATYEAKNLQNEFEKLAKTGEEPEFSSVSELTDIQSIGGFAQFVSVVDAARHHVNAIDHYQQVFTEKLEQHKEVIASSRHHHEIEHQLEHDEGLSMA